MDSEAAAQVAAELRSAREQENLTQKALAARIGLSEITIHRYESGRRSPKIDQLIHLAHALGVSGSRLLPAFLRKDAA